MEIGYTFSMKKTLFFLALFCLQIGFASVLNTQTLLSVEKVQLQYQRLLKQYDFLDELENLQDLPGSEDIIENYIVEIENSLKNNPVIVKEGAWKKIEHLFQEIKAESRVLTRKFGLAVSITVLTIELTELPMKALALHLGSPVVIILYEFLQPGILVPAIIVGIKQWNKNRKSKKLFEDKALFAKWKELEKATSKQMKLKRYSPKIALYEDESLYLIRPSNFAISGLRTFGFFRKRIDFNSLKRLCKKHGFALKELDTLKKTHYHKQIKSKVLLSILLNNYPESKPFLIDRFSKSIMKNDFVALPLDFRKWIVSLLTSQDGKQTQSLLQSFPLSLPPLLFLELWDSAIKEEFYHHNQDFKRKYYRSLERKLLPLLVKYRKAALQDRSTRPWTDESLNEVRSYFLDFLRAM